MTPSERRRRLRPPVAIAAVFGAAACAGDFGFSDGAFAPRSEVAEHLLNTFKISLWTAVGVFVVVAGLLLFAIFRRRSQETSADARDAAPAESDSRLSATRFVVAGALVATPLVLLAMAGLTFAGLAGMPQGGELEIRVTGHQWWWEVYYPQFDFETANEIHVPAGTQVQIELRSDDVIHSFWVPELAGKSDLVPGRQTKLSFEGRETGVYRGQCAEYCGLQHANMAFLVIVEPADEFREWVAQQQRPAPVQDTLGARVFEDHACSGCHTIRGVDARGQLGPDLTHLALRRTLGAATVPLTEGYLAGWIVNPQTIKPGVEMPPITTLEPFELEALLDFLLSLE